MGVVSNASAVESIGGDGTTSTLVSWTTDIPADSAVTYGLGTGPGGAINTIRNGAMTLAHAITLPGIDPHALYFATIVSNDQDGNALGYDPTSPGPTGTIGFGEIVGQAPQLSPPTADTVIVTWTTDAPGVGVVMYKADGGIDLVKPDDNDQPATDHTVKLEDLIGSMHYTCTYEVDLENSDVTVVSDPFGFTTQSATSTDAPGHVAMGSQPMRVKVGQSSTITVQVLKHDGSPQAGIPIVFSKGVGKADGNLSAESGVTDASGLCKITFTVTGIPVGRRKARRFIVAVVGAAGGKQKRRRAVVVGLK